MNIERMIESGLKEKKELVKKEKERINQDKLHLNELKKRYAPLKKYGIKAYVGEIVLPLGDDNGEPDEFCALFLQSDKHEFHFFIAKHEDTYTTGFIDTYASGSGEITLGDNLIGKDASLTGVDNKIAEICVEHISS